MSENDTPQISPRQRQAVEALMTAPTIRAAARLAKVSERQLYRWLDAPAFRAELHRAEGEALGGAARRLAALAGQAVETLAGALDADVGHSRIRAAVAILEQAQRLRELTDLEARITALEAKP